MEKLMSVAVVFPGQGSQFVGMGKDFYDKFDTVKEFYSNADKALGYGLSDIMFNGPENDLKLTQNTQPALVTMSASIWSLIKDKVQPDFFAGHSLGEYSAVYAAGGLSFEETVKAVHNRGKFMQSAVPVGAGAMSAVLGLDEDTVSKVCAGISKTGFIVEPANFNCPGQVVIAGSADAVANAHLTRLSNLLFDSSKGRYGKDTVVMFRDAARSSIGSHMPAKSLELKHTIKLIRELAIEIDEIEAAIKRIMDKEIQSPIFTIPGISYRMGAMIIAEIGDFSRFDSADKILAYAGMSPSTYQSGQLNNCHSHMEKRGSRYLRYALYNATKYVCHWDESFGTYLEKKRSEGKHYNVALSHATKKLVRLIFAMEKSRRAYIPVP